MTDPSMSDDAIVALYFARDEAATEHTIRRFGAYCLAIARRILANEQDAEECVNDTWLQAWNTIPPHRPKNLAGFLSKLTRTQAIDRLRHNGRLKRGGGECALVLDELADCLPDPSQDATLWADAVALRQVVTDFLKRESPQCRRAFLLRYFYLCPVAQIAAEMGMGESRVKMQLLRARARLREALIAQGLCEPPLNQTNEEGEYRDEQEF